MKDRALQILARNVYRSNIELLAFVVMDNHLHLVVVQGEQPLGRFMQPLLSSISLAVQSHHGLEGHVFESRFRDARCGTPEHLRNTIAYIHANPVRAGMCGAPEEYRWSSHRYYARPSHPRWLLRRTPYVPVDVARGLAAFLPPGTSGNGAAGRAAYSAFLATMLEPAAAQPEALSDEGPQISGGARSRDSGSDAACRRRSLDGIAEEVLARHPGVTIDDLRTRRGPRSRTELRAQLVFSAARAGYSGRELASFLDISESAISRILGRPGV